jgi:hypothetical protein
MLMKATKKLARNATIVSGGARGLWGRWGKARQALLVLAGFGTIDYGVFQMAGNWGWVAVGVSLLLVEAIMESDDEDDGEES